MSWAGFTSALYALELSQKMGKDTRAIEDRLRDISRDCRDPYYSEMMASSLRLHGILNEKKPNLP